MISGGESDAKRKRVVGGRGGEGGGGKKGKGAMYIQKGGVRSNNRSFGVSTMSKKILEKKKFSKKRRGDSRSF